MKRRGVLAAMGALVAAGCAKVAETGAGSSLLDAAEKWHRNAHRALGGRTALAREFDRSEVSPYFRGNGTTNPTNGNYQQHVAESFATWRLTVGGLVTTPLVFDLDNIRRLPQRTQVTRHDCVEGWSAIGEWTGPQLSVLLDAAGLLPQAKYIVFRCADDLNGAPYYESVDLVDAYHPQTILAHQLNGEALPVRNGAPLRMRIERQLGYKHAKYVIGIDAVDSLAGIGDGNGGYWEDRGYQWYAGI
jgi:DMSO/TMAO reductase YedYZ molybdopterin-dependent catalytic subunit